MRRPILANSSSNLSIDLSSLFMADNLNFLLLSLLTIITSSPFSALFKRSNRFVRASVAVTTLLVNMRTYCTCYPTQCQVP